MEGKQRFFFRTEVLHSTRDSDSHLENLTFSPLIVVTSCQEQNVENVREIVKHMRRLSLPNVVLCAEEPAVDVVEDILSDNELPQTGICYELDSDNNWSVARGNFPTDTRTYPQESETVGKITKQKTKKRSWFSKTKGNKDDGLARKFRSKSTREFSKSSSLHGSKQGSRRRVSSSQTEPKSSFNKLPGLLKKKGSKHEKNVPSTLSTLSQPEPETIKAALASWVKEATILNPPETTASLAGNIPRRNTLPVNSPLPVKKHNAASDRKVSAPAICIPVSIDFNKLSRERRRSIESLVSPNFRRRSLPEKMQEYSLEDREKIEQYRHLYSLISPRLGKKNWALTPFLSINSASISEENSSEECVFEKLREELRSRKPSNPWIFNERILSRNNRSSIKKKSTENAENPLLLLPDELRSSGEMLNIAASNDSKTSSAKNVSREGGDELSPVQVSTRPFLLPLQLPSPVSDMSLTASSSSSETLVEKSKLSAKSDSSPSEATTPVEQKAREISQDDDSSDTKNVSWDKTTPISQKEAVPSFAQLNLFIPARSLVSSSKFSTSDSTLSAQYGVESGSMSIQESDEVCQGTNQTFIKPQDFIIYNIIKEELSSKLENKVFSRSESHKLCSEISDVIKSRVQCIKLDDFKVACSVFIGALRGTGVHVASRSVWNPIQDNFTTATFSNSSLFASATVLATKY